MNCLTQQAAKTLVYYFLQDGALSANKEYNSSWEMNMEFSHMLYNSNYIFNWYTYIATIGTYDIAHSDEMLHRKK